MATYKVHFRNHPSEPLGAPLSVVEVAGREDALKEARAAYAMLSKNVPGVRVYLNGARVGREELGLGRRLERRA